MSSYDFLTQILWCNNLFKCKDHCLLYSRWTDSGFIYVKHLYNEQGFISESELYEKLTKRQNWITEYITVKKIVTNFVKKFDIDTKKSTYTNIRETKVPYIITKNKHIQLYDCKTNFFYKIFTEKKFCRPVMENYWQREFKFQITCTMWENIYIRNCINIFDIKLCEFKYKLLHNLLCCNDKLFKWKKKPSNKCNSCSLPETTKHMFYECTQVVDLWKKVGYILKIDIQWKHLVLGFNDNNFYGTFRNFIFAMLMYSIYIYSFRVTENPTVKLDYVINEYMYIYLKVIEKISLKQKSDFLNHYKLFLKNVQNVI